VKDEDAAAREDEMDNVVDERRIRNKEYRHVTLSKASKLKKNSIKGDVRPIQRKVTADKTDYKSWAEAKIVVLKY
jgi:hypothetical protein